MWVHGLTTAATAATARRLSNERLHELWERTSASDRPTHTYTTSENCIDGARLEQHVQRTKLQAGLMMTGGGGAGGGAAALQAAAVAAAAAPAAVAQIDYQGEEAGALLLPRPPGPAAAGVGDADPGGSDGSGGGGGDGSADRQPPDAESKLPSLVSAAVPSWMRSILTEIYLCHACSRQEIEDGNASGRAAAALRRSAAAAAAAAAQESLANPPRRWLALPPLGI
eukprot:COSAG01_NODE_4641_length_4858_cov_6.174827_3_plen_226_part_00